jgi:hypothetical protein
MGGEHLERVPLAAPARRWREAVNAATVLGLRARPAPPPLERAGLAYPKVFVVGCGRSGTSWVQSIIGMQPSVVTTQESHAYEVVYGRVSAAGHRSVAAWAKVLHRHDLGRRERRWVGLHWWIDRAPLCDLIASAMAVHDRAPADVAQDVIEAIFDDYFARHGGSPGHTLLEKSPGHLRYADVILRRYPEAKIVEVVRDGRDVCVSMQMQALTLRWPPTERAAQVRTWVDAVRAGIALRNNPAFASRVHLVRYEALKADPQRVIEGIYAFCGFAPGAVDLADAVDRSSFRHHRSTGDGRHTRRGEVGDWQNHFTPQDEELFRSLAGDVFEAAGYSY